LLSSCKTSSKSLTKVGLVVQVDKTLEYATFIHIRHCSAIDGMAC
jgi:hypothetical protein